MSDRRRTDATPIANSREITKDANDSGHGPPIASYREIDPRERTSEGGCTPAGDRAPHEPSRSLADRGSEESAALRRNEAQKYPTLTQVVKALEDVLLFEPPQGAEHAWERAWAVLKTSERDDGTKTRAQPRSSGERVGDQPAFPSSTATSLADRGSDESAALRSLDARPKLGDWHVADYGDENTGPLFSATGPARQTERDAAEDIPRRPEASTGGNLVANRRAYEMGYDAAMARVDKAEAQAEKLGRIVQRGFELVESAAGDAWGTPEQATILLQLSDMLEHQLDPGEPSDPGRAAATAVASPREITKKTNDYAARAAGAKAQEITSDDAPDRERAKP